ncbi:MAG: alkaline phosphatase D family protein [candidate division KSB1 bacterium]|nr:alkaline phosphatase D family protein [candidate division KSB1 bacterium]
MFRLYLLFIILFSSTFDLYAQLEIPQYKKQNRNVIADVVNGDTPSAQDYFQSYLQTHAGDLESMYGLALCYSVMNKPDSAVFYVQQALNHGLPFGRFLAGPRDLFKSLHKHPDFKRMIKERDIELVHGPMLGNVTDRSASFWVRTFRQVPVQVTVSDHQGNVIHSPVVKTNPDHDYTAILSVNTLLPDQTYHYQLSIGGHLREERYTFRTFPAEGYPAQFSIGFGGGAGYTPPYERMWNTIASKDLIAFLLLGDNVYIDHPKIPQVQQYCYYRRQSRPEYRSFVSSSSIFAIWDDHDFTDNDGFGGPEIDTPSWKRPVWNTFKNNWINPYYGGGKPQPGCWFDFSIGDVDFIMLDGRYYRMNPKVEHPSPPSMLGEAQKQWLFQQLASSKATFKVICSPVPWAQGAKPGKVDTWDGFPQEREDIYSFIENQKIDGVILLSADRHRSDAWKIERPDGYDFYEFESSKISNIHTHDVLPASLFGYNDKSSFGRLNFDTTKDDPVVAYSVYSIDNELVHKITVKKSQLSFQK